MQIHPKRPEAYASNRECPPWEISVTSEVLSRRQVYSLPSLLRFTQLKHILFRKHMCVLLKASCPVFPIQILLGWGHRPVIFVLQISGECMIPVMCCGEGPILENKHMIPFAFKPTLRSQLLPLSSWCLPSRPSVQGETKHRHTVCNTCLCGCWTLNPTKTLTPSSLGLSQSSRGTKVTSQSEFALHLLQLEMRQTGHAEWLLKSLTGRM